MVRLEGLRKILSHRFPLYFNSYMVRLEETSASLLKISHYISIPIWCDWKIFFVWVWFRRYTISIPIWCDWKQFANNEEFMRAKFQFLYGAIGRSRRTNRQAAKRKFQFVYGSIGRVNFF